MSEKNADDWNMEDYFPKIERGDPGYSKCLLFLTGDI
jgi:hypothetical protein